MLGCLNYILSDCKVEHGVAVCSKRWPQPCSEHEISYGSVGAREVPSLYLKSA